MKYYEYNTGTVGNAENMKEIDIENDDDATISDKVAARLSEAKPLHDSISARACENMALFKGKIDDLDPVVASKYNSKALKNVIFLTIRNLVGLSTDHPPIPDVSPAKQTPQSIKKAKILASSLDWDMVRTKFQDLLGLMLFDTWVKADSYLHWFWNKDTNDVDVIGVKVEDISFSPGATSVQDSEYTVYHPVKNRKWFKEHYPDFYDYVKFESVNPDGSINTIGSGGRGSVARVYSYWEDEIHIKQVMGKEGKWLILEKEKNPYWEFRSSDDQILEWAQQAHPEAIQMAQQAGIPDAEGVKSAIDPEEVQNFIPIINFLPKPTKPFVQIPSIKLLDSLYSEDIIAQIRAIFLDINKKKRQIADNLRGCGSKLVIDSQSFSEKEKAAITDEPLQVLMADFSQNSKPAYYLEPTHFEIDKIMLDIQDDERYIDDVFGHHEISRGSGNSGTLGQDQMNAESDKTPVRFQVRAVESAIVDLWKGWIQLKKLFYTDVHYIKKFGATDGSDDMKLMGKDIEDGIDPILQPMSTAPLSRSTKAAQSMELFGMQAIDPRTLYEDLGRNDPDSLVNRLVNWVKFGIISAEDPNQVAADMQNHSLSPGDTTENPVERADQENKAMQAGDNVQPTPLELVTPDHVKLHFAFLKDKKNQMEQDAKDNFLNHAEADKATLIEKMKSGMLNTAADQVMNENQPSEAQQQPAPKAN